MQQQIGINNSVTKKGVYETLGAVGEPLAQHVLYVFRNVFIKLNSRRLHWQTIRNLSKLSDHLLTDIGLERYDIRPTANAMRAEYEKSQRLRHQKDLHTDLAAWQSIRLDQVRHYGQY